MLSRTVEQTDAPFAQAFSELLSECGLSRRELARLTPSVDGRGLGHSYLQMLATGEKAPTVANIVLLAPLLGVAPSFFREYREAMVQAEVRRLVAEHGAAAVRAKLAELG